MFRPFLRRSLNSGTTISCVSSFRRQLCSAPASLSCVVLYRPMRVARCFNAAAITLLYSPIALATRSGSSVARKSCWRAATRRGTWRNAKKKLAKSPSMPPQRRRSRKRRLDAVPKRKVASRAVAQKSASRRRRQPLRKLSPYDRQTEKYNKRVVAIARLWKEQRQGVQKKRKSLASRLA